MLVGTAAGPAVPDDASAQQPLVEGFPVPLEVGALSDPTAVPVRDGWIVVYELILANPVRDTLVVTELEISAHDGTTIARVSKADWASVAVRLPAPADGEQRGAADRGLVLAGGERWLVYLWLPLDPGAVPPPALAHELEVSSGSADSELHWTLRGPELTVSTTDLVIDAPVRGGRWLVRNGFANDTDHRRFFVASGDLQIPQRFGADFLALDEGGGNADPGPVVNEAFHAFGEPLYAVADGEVVSVLDGLADIDPGTDPGRLAWEAVPGNHVVLRIRPNAYALYAHLGPGTIEVEIGQRVRRGDPIARIGNSGNTSAPHLHFHMMDGPEPNEAEGVPFLFRSFELLLADYRFLPEQRPLPGDGVTIEASVPAYGWVVRFPD